MKFTKILRWFLEFGNYGYYKEFKIFRIPFRFPKYNRTEEIFIQTRLANTVQKTHTEVFSEYKNINYAKEVVLIAPGPTLNYYKPLSNVVNVGVNRAFTREDILFDYLFAIDRGAIKPYFDDLKIYRNDSCKKFLGIGPYLRNRIVQNDIYEAGAKCFYTTTSFNNVTADITCCELPDLGSVIFSAFMFALWTNPKKIYLVGCDCSGGYFDDLKFKISRGKLIKSWKKVGRFAKLNYPDTEIISVNPIGLKGLFKDVYTKDFAETLDSKDGLELI